MIIANNGRGRTKTASFAVALCVCLAGLLFAVRPAAGDPPDAETPETSLPGVPGAGRQAVVIIHSYDPASVWTRQVQDAFRATLHDLAPEADLYVEYLDAKRFEDPTLRQLQAHMMNRKYHGRKTDLVLVSDDAALAFARENRDVLFPGAPIVFCGVSREFLSVGPRILFSSCKLLN